MEQKVKMIIINHLQCSNIELFTNSASIWAAISQKTPRKQMGDICQK